MRNSFKDLEKLEMEEVSMPNDAIKNGIASDIGIMRFVSSVVEMYFPRVVDLFIGLSGGTDKDADRRPSSNYPDMN